MSFRRGRGMAAKRPINSRKNIVQNITIGAAASETALNIAIAVEGMPALAATSQVVAGARINTVYIEAWVYGNAVAGVNSPITWSLAKNPGGNLNLPQPSAAGADDNKRWIFAMGKGLVGNSANGQPGYLIRGWFSIPNRMRRFGFGDTLVLNIENNTANDLNICELIIYKWYY